MDDQKLINLEKHINQRELEYKWGKDVIDSGWLAVPNLLLSNQKALELTSVELNVLLVLLTYWWKPKSKATPSIETIANKIGKTPRSVSTVIKSLATKPRDIIPEHARNVGVGGLIEVQHRSKEGKKTSNSYTFNGLHYALNIIHAQKKLTAEIDEEINDNFDEVRELTKEDVNNIVNK